MLKNGVAEVATLALMLYNISASCALCQDNHVPQRVYSAQHETNRIQKHLPHAVAQACFLILQRLCQSERKEIKPKS